MCTERTFVAAKRRDDLSARPAGTDTPAKRIDKAGPPVKPSFGRRECRAPERRTVVELCVAPFDSVLHWSGMTAAIGRYELPRELVVIVILRRNWLRIALGSLHPVSGLLRDERFRRRRRADLEIVEWGETG